MANDWTSPPEPLYDLNLGDKKTVTLVAIAGHKIISGGNLLASGTYDPARTDGIVHELVQKGFGHQTEPVTLELVSGLDARQRGIHFDVWPYCRRSGQTRRHCSMD